MGRPYYYAQNGQRLGPVSSTELRNLANAGRLQPSDLVWNEDMPAWKPAGTIKGLFPSGGVTPLPASSAAIENRDHAELGQFPAGALPVVPGNSRSQQRQVRFWWIAVAAGASLILVIALTATILLASGRAKIGRPTDETTGRGGDSEAGGERLSAAQLVVEYTDAMATHVEKNYAGRELTVSGPVLWSNHASINIYAGSKPKTLTGGYVDRMNDPKVVCDFAAGARTRTYADLAKPGQTVVVKGVWKDIDPQAHEITLANCRFATDAEASSAKPAAQILSDCASSTSNAERKYKDKILMVEGVVKEVKMNARNRFPAVRLQSTTDRREVLEAFFGLKDVVKLERLKPGDEIVLKGICVGASLRGVEFKDCALVKTPFHPQGRGVVDDDEIDGKPVRKDRRPAKEDDQPPPDPGSSGVSQANYDRIRDGMTLAQVERILGDSGVKHIEQKTGGTKGTMYYWNKGNRIITVTFLNGSVIGKAKNGF